MNGLSTSMMVPGPVPTDKAAAHRTGALHQPQCMSSSEAHAPHLVMDSELMDLWHKIEEGYRSFMLTQLAEIQSTLNAHGEELGAIRRTCVDITEQEHSISARTASLRKDATHVTQDIANISLRSDQGQEDDDVGNGKKANNHGKSDVIHDQIQELLPIL